MKTAKEVLIDGKTFTHITCCDCGNETLFGEPGRFYVYVSYGIRDGERERSYW